MPHEEQDVFEHQMHQDDDRHRLQDEHHRQLDEQDALLQEEEHRVEQANEVHRALHEAQYNLQEYNRRAREERQVEEARREEGKQVEEARCEEHHELRCMANPPRCPYQANLEEREDILHPLQYEQCQHCNNQANEEHFNKLKFTMQKFSGELIPKNSFHRHSKLIKYFVSTTLMNRRKWQSTLLSSMSISSLGGSKSLNGDENKANLLSPHGMT